LSPDSRILFQQPFCQSFAYSFGLTLNENLSGIQSLCLIKLYVHLFSSYFDAKIGALLEISKCLEDFINYFIGLRARRKGRR
jgi:hypothetical protein